MWRGGACPDDVLDLLAFHNDFARVFAFNAAWVASYDAAAAAEQWRVFDMAAELARLGVPNSGWRLSDVNREHARCATYPELLCVPARVSDADLGPVFGFRSRGRIPVLVWQHAEHGAALCRCAQPSVGLKNARCDEDERLFEAVAALRPGRPLWIVDARPKIAARANQLKGRGVDKQKRYRGCTVLFMDIANIHKMREALGKLEAVVMRDHESALPFRVPATKWLAAVHLVLGSAVEVARRLEQGDSVVVHCSDGWDRTAQLSALAQLLLDPYFASYRGFAVLVEKEWAAFGHKFRDRCRQQPTSAASREQSPIFLQFLDCVRQLLVLCPAAFEFGEQYLVVLAEEVYSGRFGTFLFNSPAERRCYLAETRTLPVWAYLEARRGELANPHYCPGTRLIKDVLARGVHVSLWEAYYLRGRRLHAADSELPLTTPWKEPPYP